MTLTSQKNEIATKAGSVKDFLIQKQQEIAEACTSNINSKRLISVVLNSFKGNPDLEKCTFESMLDCVKASASLGLEPDGITGQAYIIPYEDRKKRVFEAQFQIGYKGLITLARRSGFIKSLSAQPVYEQDYFEYEYGLDEKLVHRPAIGPRGKLKYAYAVAKFTDGGHHFEVMTKADIDKIRNSSMGANSKYSPWTKWEEEMWRKTATKKLCKFLPFAAELASAAEKDEYDDMDLKEANVTPMTQITDSNKNDLADRLTQKEEKKSPIPTDDGTVEDDKGSELPAEDFRSEIFALIEKLDKKNEFALDKRIPDLLGGMGYPDMESVGTDDCKMVIDYCEKEFKKVIA
jgi:recombination protein RecT